MVTTAIAVRHFGVRRMNRDPSPHARRDVGRQERVSYHLAPVIVVVCCPFPEVRLSSVAHTGNHEGFRVGSPFRAIRQFRGRDQHGHADRLLTLAFGVLIVDNGEQFVGGNLGLGVWCFHRFSFLGDASTEALALSG